MVSAAVSAIITVIGLSVLLIALLYFLVSLSKLWKNMMKSRILKALKKRRNTKDTFRETNGYSWDYFMAFKVYNENEELSDDQIKYNMKFILTQLGAGGMEIRIFYSLQHKEVFCKIRCPLARLQKHADLIDYKLALDKNALKSLCSVGREGLWEPLKIPEKSEMTHLDPYEYIYAKYEFDSETQKTPSELISLYRKWPKAQLNADGNDFSTSIGGSPIGNPMADTSTNDSGEVYNEADIFRGVDRLKLIHSIITYHGPGGCCLDPYQLKKDDCILSYEPLHDYVELRELESKWLNFLQWPWKQPVDDIRNYFGEKIGLYFVWLGLYTTWLIVAGVVGFFLWIDIAYKNNDPNAPTVPYYAGFMGLWSSLFLENWKRTEKRTALRWGMVGFEEEEQDRPQFQGEKVLSPIDGKPTLYFSRFERSKRSFYSQSIICVLIFVVIAVVACIFAIRVVISNAQFQIAGVQMASIIASILLSLQIQFLNGYFGEVALSLNINENHRTDTEFEDSLIAKTFSFQFVNSFASLFYIAFVKPFIPDIDSCTGSCMLDLQTTLGTIFLTRLAIGNLTELGIPLVSSYFKTNARKSSYESKKKDDFYVNHNVNSMDGGIEMHSFISKELAEADKHEMSEIEKIYLMPKYDVLLGTFDDYAEMAIQFGYTTLFVAAFPLAAILSFVNNYVEIRVDAWKICQLCSRPEPRSAEDIGTWYYILEVISMASIFINSALVAFTGSNTINYTWSERIWIFILMASGLFAIRLIVAFIIPDIPSDVSIQLDRQEYIVGKVLHNIEDEDESALSKINFQVPNYLVDPTDDDPL